MVNNMMDADVTQLLDANGQPLKAPSKAELTEEIAGPTFGGVRQIASGHAASGLTPARLGAILKEAETGDGTAYLELAEAMEEKDLHYASVLSTRKRAIRRLKLKVVAGDETDRAVQAAADVRSALTSCATTEDLIHMLDALGKGYSATEIIWDVSSTPWTIGRLEERDPRWFRFDQLSGRIPLLRDNNGDLPLQPYRFVFHRARLKSGLPMRSGLARLVAWAYVFKNYTLKDWNIFLEAYGHPLRLGKYGPNATNEEKATLLRAMRRVGVDMAAIMPQSMDYEIINGSITGGDKMFENAARYWDEQISKAVLGQVSTTDAIAGGHAVGKVHEEVREDIRDADAEQLASTLTRDVAVPMTMLSYGPEVAPPKVSFEAEEKRDPRMTLLAIRTFGPMGLDVSQRQVREDFGLREPEEGDALLSFTTATQASDTDVPIAKQTASASGMLPNAIMQAATGLVADGTAQGQMNALLGGLLDELTEVDNLEDARTLVALALEQAPDDEVRDLLARLTFAGRIAGEVGADIG